MATTLVLWDIDHTLIETRGVGGLVYAEAFAKVTGRELEKMPELAGRTEPVIFREALKVNGVEPAKNFTTSSPPSKPGYAAHLDELRARGRALPGAAEALHALSQRDDAIQSVLTGNTRPSAEIKLHSFDLDRYLDFDIGAYGTDDDTRANLVGVARQRAGKAHGVNFDDGATVLIGDTPNDVAAALASGARIIAVATGQDSATALSEAGAETVATRPHRHGRRPCRHLRAERMTHSSALDAAIRQARHLLFAFDGPIRSTDAGMPAGSNAHRPVYLRGTSQRSRDPAVRPSSLLPSR